MENQLSLWLNLISFLTATHIAYITVEAIQKLFEKFNKRIEQKKYEIGIAIRDSKSNKVL